jgi:hypothetical protein
VHEAVEPSEAERSGAERGRTEKAEGEAGVGGAKQEDSEACEQGRGDAAVDWYDA